MPLRPDIAPFYRSPAWRALRAAVLERAGSRCEQCGVEDRTWIDRDTRRPHSHDAACVGECDGVAIILTVAHLDYADSGRAVALDRLQALCQRCHNALDAPHRAKRAARTRRGRGGQATLPGVEP